MKEIEIIGSTEPCSNSSEQMEAEIQRLLAKLRENFKFYQRKVNADIIHDLGEEDDIDGVEYDQKGLIYYLEEIYVFNKKGEVLVRDFLLRCNNEWGNLADISDILDYIDRISAIHQCARVLRYRYRSGYPGFNCRIDNLDILDAIVESGDQKALKYLLPAASTPHRVYRQLDYPSDWFNYVSLFKGRDFKILDRVREILIERGQNIRSESTFSKKKRSDLYSDPLMFEKPPEFPEVPLSAETDHTLFIEASTGCEKASNDNSCKFCTNPLRKQHFKAVDIEVFIRRLHRMRHELDESEQKKVRKVFLTGADFLALPEDQIKMMLRIVKGALFESLCRVQKIEAFASVPSIVRHQEELQTFREFGLTTLYVGGESGDDNILEMMGKNQNQLDIISGCRLLRDAGITCSLFIIPGLGGFKHRERNAKNTAKLIRRAQPDFVNILPLKDPPGECIDAIESEAGNRLMISSEIQDEILMFKNYLRSVPKREWEHRVRVEAYGPEDVGLEGPYTMYPFQITFGNNRRRHRHH